MWFVSNILGTERGWGAGGRQALPKSKTVHRHGTSASYWAHWSSARGPNMLTRPYRFRNDIPVHSISTGRSTLTQSRWAPSCHTWRRTNLTWHKWADFSLLLIKMGRGRKTFLKGQSIKDKRYEAFSTAVLHIVLSRAAWLVMER